MALQQERADRPLRISILMATLNESRRLPIVLESIKSQNYPHDSIEIIVADGGSTDGTRQIIQNAGCRLIDNPLVRGEPGIALGFAHATGDVAVLIAADNPLRPGFLDRIIKPFEDPAMAGAIPQVVSGPTDCFTSRYFNAFTDPFNHFLYGRRVAPWSFAGLYPVVKSTDNYIVYDFRGRDYPLLALAQGFSIRLPYTRPAGLDEDDVAPVMHLIDAGKKLAYVPGAHVEHHSVRSLRNSLEKFGPRIRARLTSRDQPIWERAESWSRMRRLRAYMWPFYATSFVWPVLTAAVGLVRDHRREWVWHPIVSFAFAMEFWKQVAGVARDKYLKPSGKGT
jgi:glycosyltransferase involved in cell wall biosynthesis